MKSLKEQISGKCIHFNGIMNECCKAGISYASVREGKPNNFPCLKQGGECSNVRFLSEQEVEERLSEIKDREVKTLIAYTKIKEHFNKTKDNPGKLPCECGGELKYIVTESNGHIRANCSTCHIHFMD